MSRPDWTELTRFAIALAEASAAAILPYFRQNTQVEVKDGPVWDPVTEGDRAGERAIRAMIEKHYTHLTPRLRKDVLAGTRS